MKNDIIIFGMNKFDDWKNNRNLNRSFYIFQEMIKRNEIDKILYIDYLPVKRYEAILAFPKIINKLFKNVFFKTLFSYCCEIKKNKIYNYSTILSVINWKIFYQELNKLISRLNLNHIILWSFYPLNVDYFDYLKNDTTVLHLDDNWQHHNSLQNGLKINYLDVLRKNYNSISKKADYIFSASDELLEIFMGHDNSYWIDDVEKNEIKDYDWKKLVNEMFNKFNK